MLRRRDFIPYTEEVDRLADIFKGETLEKAGPKT
jgi:hypothetical protein